jgi:hypothetical protein
MDQGNLTIDELRALLARDRRRAWVKLVVGPEEDGTAPIWAAQVTVGPKPPGWQTRRWAYPDCHFIAIEMTSRKFSSALSVPGPTEIALGTTRATFNLTNGVWWTHLGNRQTYTQVELPWPSKYIGFNTQIAVNQPAGYMVGENCPSFSSFAEAFNTFIYEDSPQAGANQPNLGQVLVHLVDGRARIRRAVVRPLSLDVWVSGRAVKGLRLELSSSTEREEMELEGIGKVSFSLTTGLGRNPWLWLKGDEGWIDFLQLLPQGGRQNPNVEFDLPGDPVAEILALAAEGENTHLEYKSELPGKTADSKRKTLKTIVAFANGEGGTILLGVKGDENAGDIVGFLGTPAAEVRRLNDLIHDRVSPTPTIHPSIHEVDGRNVIRLDVDSGGGILHALFLEPNNPEYYVRRNGSTYLARPEEIAQIVERRLNQQPATGLRSLL